MDGEFDPQAFISGADTATQAPPEQPQALPTVTPTLSTFYYPATPDETRAAGLSYGMEGGIHGGGRFGDIDLRNHTLEQYLDGKSPFVAVAMKGEPTGQEFMTKILDHTVLARNVDTGGGLKDGQIDFATSNPDLARSGIEHGPFDPQAFINRQDVPDIHAFMEPAPDEAQPGETPEPKENVGSIIGKGISAFGKGIASQKTPHLDFNTPQIRQMFEQPQGAAQVPFNMIPTAQPTPAAQPTPFQPQQFQPNPMPFPTPSVMPTPQQTPYNPNPIPGDFMHNLGVLGIQTVDELKAMANAPIELSQQALNPQLSIPSRLAAAAGVIASAAQLDPLLPHGAAPKGLGAVGKSDIHVVDAVEKLSSQDLGPNQQRYFNSLVNEVKSRGLWDLYKQRHPESNMIVGSNREVPVPESLQPKGATSEPLTQAQGVGIMSDAEGNISKTVPFNDRSIKVTINPKGRIEFESVGGSTVHPMAKTRVGAFKTMNEISPAIRDLMREKLRKNSDQQFVFYGTAGGREALYQRYLERAGIPAKPSRRFSIPQDHPLREGLPTVQPPSVGGVPPTQPPVAAPQPPAPSYSKTLNPTRDHGPFTKTYKIDKELGEMMDGLGAAPEHGALVAETQSRNMLHELSPQQEKDVGDLLLSDRLRRVNPQHPQVMLDSLARGIESVPANKKAIEYYRKNIEPELEDWGKKAGLKEDAAATQRGAYFTLVPERLPDGTIPELASRLGQTSRTTKYSYPAEGQAAKYSSDIREVLRESYTERIRKAKARELFDAAHAKGVVVKTPEFVPDPANGPNAGKWVSTIKEQNLPEGMKHDLNLIAQGRSSMQPEGLQKVLQGYQRTATTLQLTGNPLEIMNHLRRQLHILATKPPIGQGLMARLESVVPFFGPKIGALKRAMSDMNTPARQQILRDITSQGGGSSRSFRERYGTKIPGLKQVSDFTSKMLFGYPSGKGVMGFDLRMRVLLEEIRRNAEPALAKDKQRMRVFANQMGQYGTMASWPVRALRHVNPYAATTLPMRWTELRTLFGGSGLKSSSIPQALLRRAETFMRGTGGTIAMLTIANKLLSGHYPWQNKKGHEFDLYTGVQDKDGNDIYVPNRFLSPEMFRAISTFSIPQLLAEQGAPNRSALSETAAATLGPINAGLSLVNSPAAGIAAAAGPQWALHAEKWPGQKSIDIMKVGQYTAQDQARGIPPLLKRAEGVAEQIHPLLASIVGYMDEPIKGLKPLGIFKVDKQYRGGGGYSRSASGRGSGGRGSGRGTGGR